MPPVDLLTQLRRRPFQPFKLVTTDGTGYEIKHPDMAFVTIGSAIIGYPNEQMPALAARYDIVSLRQVVRLEVIDSLAAQAPDVPARRIAKSWRGHKLLVWQGKRRKGRRQEPWKAAYWGR